MIRITNAELVQAVSSQLYWMSPFFKVPGIDGIIQDVLKAAYKRNKYSEGKDEYGFFIVSFKNEETFKQWLSDVLFENADFKMLSLTPREKAEGMTEPYDGVRFVTVESEIDPMDDFVDLSSVIQNINYVVKNKLFM